MNWDIVVFGSSQVVLLGALAYKLWRPGEPSPFGAGMALMGAMSWASWTVEKML